MSKLPKPSTFSRRLLGLMRQAIANDGNTPITPITHRVPITMPGFEVPVTYTIQLEPDEKGGFMVSCRELPDILTHGEDEEEALALAVLAIGEELAQQRRLPNSPG